MEIFTVTAIQPVGMELAIAWKDGREDYLSLEYLRRHCPCAACGGEPDVMGRVERPEVEYSDGSFVLSSLTPVGGYGIQPRWGDGHATGIYSFLYLRKLADSQRAG